MTELAATLESHRLWLSGDPTGQYANLRGANLRGANLGGAGLQGADLGGANLWDAYLWDADLQGADLQGADLWDADLQGANLRYANLQGANLRAANLRGANLGGANLEGARLADAILSEAKGIIWAQAGPVGCGPRTTTAIWQAGQMMHHAGCFSGTRADYEAHIDAGGWDWPPDRADQIAADLRDTIDWCESQVRRWLEAIPS